MKKIIAIATLSLASITACGGGGSTDEKSWDDLKDDQKDLLCWTTSDSDGKTRPYDEIVETIIGAGNHEPSYAHDVARLATENC